MVLPIPTEHWPLARDSRKGQEKDLQRQWGAGDLVLGASRPPVRQLHSKGLGEGGLAGDAKIIRMDPLQELAGRPFLRSRGRR